MKRRRHYVPRFLLNRFADHGRIFVSDRQCGTTRQAGVGDVALQKDFYRIDIPDLALQVAAHRYDEISKRIAQTN